jgi:hypothetical protein
MWEESGNFIGLLFQFLATSEDVLRERSLEVLSRFSEGLTFEQLCGLWDLHHQFPPTHRDWLWRPLSVLFRNFDLAKELADIMISVVYECLEHNPDCSFNSALAAVMNYIIRYSGDIAEHCDRISGIIRAKFQVEVEIDIGPLLHAFEMTDKFDDAIIDSFLDTAIIGSMFDDPDENQEHSEQDQITSPS